MAPLNLLWTPRQTTDRFYVQDLKERDQFPMLRRRIMCGLRKSSSSPDLSGSVDEVLQRVVDALNDVAQQAPLDKYTLICTSGTVVKKRVEGFQHVIGELNDIGTRNEGDDCFRVQVVPFLNCDAFMDESSYSASRVFTAILSAHSPLILIQFT